MAEQVTENNQYRTLVRDRQFVSITLISVLATLGTNVASPALPAMADAMGVNDSRVGLVISMHSVLAMIAVPFTGVISDIHGRRTVLLPSVFLFGLAGSAIAIVDSFQAILVLRAIQGVAYAAMMPITVAVLGDLYVGSKASIAQGLRVGANGTGSTVVPVLAGFLAGFSWNYPFLLYLIALPTLLIALCYLPESSRSNGDMPERRSWTAIQMYVRNIRNEIGQIDLRVLLFGEAVRDFIRYGLLTFVPLFAVRSLEASVATAGMVLSVRGIVYIGIGPVSGRIVSRFSRKRVLVASLVISAASVALMPFSPSFVWLAVLLGTYTIGDSLFSPVIKDAVTVLASDERRGGIVSGMNMLKYGGQASSPAVFGIVLGLFGFSHIFFIAAAIALVYTLLIFGYISHI